MANEFIARNGLIAQNNSTITGSLTVTQGITGSLLGTASYATQALSSSYSATSSIATSASFATTASYVDTLRAAGGNIYAVQYNNSSGILVGSNRFTFDGATLFIGSGSLLSATGSLQGSSSYALTASYALNAGGIPGGSDTQLQYNNNGVFAGTLGINHIAASRSLQHGNGVQTTGFYSYAQGYISIASGDYSHAEGIGTQAIGNSSHAEGYYTTASGDYSHAEGRFSKAIGYNSHAEGASTYSLGGNSHAEGSLTSASGDYSHAEGATTISSGNYSHAEGYQTQTVGVSSHAEGANTISSGNYSHAEGYQTQTAGDYSHAEGINAVTYTAYSHAEGTDTRAIGISSHAEGDATQTGTTVGYSASFANGTGSLDSIYGDLTTIFPAGNLLYLNDVDYDYVFGAQTFIIGGSYFNGTNTEIYIVFNNSTTKAIIGNISVGVAGWLGDQKLGGPYSHAEGVSTISLGTYSHAEGTGAQAIGDYSHAEGVGTQAVGDYSHAEGSSNITIGQGSHAEGEINTTIGSFSHAEGSNTVAGTYAYEGATTLGVITLSARYGDVSTQFGTHIVFDDLSQTYYLELDPLNTPYFDGTNTILTLVDTTFTPPKTVVAIPGNLYPPFADYIMGDYSHVEGEFTQTYGRVSHAAGLSTIAVADYQHVIGKYNLQTNGASFVIGNGTGDGTRSNLLIASESVVQITGSLNVTGSEIVIQTDYFGVLNGNTNASLIEATPGAGVYIWSVNANPSADFENRQLIKSDGTTVTVDWENGIFTGSFSGSFAGSIANATTASYASTASYVNGNTTKANVVAAGAFGGTPLTASITFTTAFPNTDYSVTITGEDARVFTIQNKLAGGFEINTNSNVALTGDTHWHAINYGEFNS